MKHLYQPLFARSNPEIETVTTEDGEVTESLETGGMSLPDDEGGMSLPEEDYDYDFTEDTPYYLKPVLYKGPQPWDTLTDDQQYLIYYIDFAEHHQAPEGVEPLVWASMSRQERIASSADTIADDAILAAYFEGASVTDYQSVDLIGEVDVITRDYINAVTSGAADLEADSLQFIVGMVLNVVLDLKENEVFSGVREDILDRYLIERLPNALHLFLFTAFPAYTPQQLIDCFAIALEAEDTQDELDFVEAEASALCSESNLANTPSSLQANFAVFCDKASNSSETKQAYYNNVFPWEDGFARASLLEGTAVVNSLVSGLGELNAEEVSELMENLVIEDSPVQDIAAASNRNKPTPLRTKIALGIGAVLIGRGLYVAYKQHQGENVKYFGTLLDSSGPIRPVNIQG
jgi:hypothetical protein